MLSAGPDGVIKKVREKNEFWGQYGVPDCSSRLRDFEYVRYSGRHSREMCMSVRGCGLRGSKRYVREKIDVGTDRPRIRGSCR
jgi:hypothetical protein